MFKHEDKRGLPIHMHSEVYVNEPTGVWATVYPFMGTVVGMSELFVTVEDQDQNCYDVDPETLEVQIPSDGEDYDDSDNVCPECKIGNLKTIMVDDTVGHGMSEKKSCDFCNYIS